MMAALYRQEGAMMQVEILREPEVLSFIDAHAATLNSTFAKVDMSERMRSSLEKSNWVFSGMKTFHELHEAFPSLLNENGERKPFERFLNDVRKVDETYNQHYLRAEYNFVTASAEMAAKWEQIEEDGDRYHLQYRTAGDDKVREEHASLHGITLPPSDDFWSVHYPPNGWNCRCTAVQVLKSRYPQTPAHEVAQRQEALAQEQARRKGKSEMFRFNPGKERKAFPDYNPYTIRRCNDCDLAKGKMKLASIEPNELCSACTLLRRNEELRYSEIRQYENGGKILQHHLVNDEDSDYNKLIKVAEFFAKEGCEVRLTPKMKRPPNFVYEDIYSSLIGTPYEDKCPDLLIDGKWYEHEGFITDDPKNAFRNMMNHGLKQSSRLIIDQPNLEDWFMLDGIQGRQKVGKQIDEIWIRNGENLRLLYKNRG